MISGRGEPGGGGRWRAAYPAVPRRRGGWRAGYPAVPRRRGGWRAGYPAVPWRRGRHRPRVLGHQVATTTAGSQPTEMMGAQLPCRTACTIELTATTATAIAVTTCIPRAHGFMTASFLSSVLVI